jgi:hypothetical protein
MMAKCDQPVTIIVMSRASPAAWSMAPPAMAARPNRLMIFGLRMEPTKNSAAIGATASQSTSTFFEEVLRISERIG